jgi:hypothetical protein
MSEVEHMKRFVARKRLRASAFLKAHPSESTEAARVRGQLQALHSVRVELNRLAKRQRDGTGGGRQVSASHADTAETRQRLDGTPQKGEPTPPPNSHGPTYVRRINRRIYSHKQKRREWQKRLLKNPDDPKVEVQIEYHTTWIDYWKSKRERARAQQIELGISPQSPIHPTAMTHSLNIPLSPSTRDEADSDTREARGDEGSISKSLGGRENPHSEPDPANHDTKTLLGAEGSLKAR